MASIIQPKILKGFRDFLPDQEINRKEITTTLTEVYESYGFVPIDTPVLEYTEILLGKGSGETDKQIYRFNDNGGRDVSMRFDLTVPFARFMAQYHNDLQLPFKRYHISKVWRGENTQKGRYREFTQCDFDIVGTDNAESDYEILSIMNKSFEKLGIKNIEFKISHRGIFNKMLESLNLSENLSDILRTVDKLAKIGIAATQAELTAITNDKEKTAKILEYIQAEGNFLHTLDKIEALSGGESEHSLRLRKIYEYLQAEEIADNFIIDPSITRGLDYYTGIVYETFFKDLPSIGSVCSGGRYNNLASLYTKQELPGVGSSIGLDRLIAALQELDLISSKPSKTECIILNFDSKLKKEYFKLATRLREAGIKTEVFLDDKKLGPQLNFAEKKSIPTAIICGEDEIQQGFFTLKNIKERNNIKVEKFDNLIEEIKKILK
ncbi:MAG: histidine--tRNA ligase [Spirochaetales bacterium]|nr:histidine--tRNA ligase [Spirochaetales bacterium]